MTDQAGKPRWRWWMWISTTMLAVLLALVAAGPTLLSTAPGNRLLLRTINSRIRGSVTARSIQLAWFGGQSAADLSVLDSDGVVVASGIDVHLPDYALLHAVFGGNDYGQIRLTADQIEIRQASGKSIDLYRAASSSGNSGSGQSPFHLGARAKLDFKARLICYKHPDIEPIQFHDVGTIVDLLDDQKIRIAVSGDIEQGGQAGKIDANIRFEPAVGDQVSALIDAEVELASFPLDVVDRIVGQEGRLIAVIGSQLDMKIKAKGSVDALVVELNVKAEQFSFEGTLHSDNGRLRTGAGSKLMLALTPKSYAAMSNAAGPQPPRLLEPFWARVAIKRLEVPWTRAGVDLSGTKLNLVASIAKVVLDVSNYGPVVLHGAQITITSQDAITSLQADLEATMQLGEIRRPVLVGLALRQPLAGWNKLDVILTAQRLPVALIDAVVDRWSGGIAAAIGTQLDLVIHLRRQPDKSLVFDGQVTTTGMTGRFIGTFDSGTALSLSTPEPFKMSLSPDVLRTWGMVELPILHLVLDQTVELALDLNQLDLVWLDALMDGSSHGLDLNRCRMDATLNATSAVFRHPESDGQIIFNQPAIEVKGTRLDEQLDLTFQSRIGDGSVQMITRIHQPFSSTMRITESATFTDMQTLQIDSLAGQSGKLAAVLGPNLSLQVDANFESNLDSWIDLSLTSDNIVGRVVFSLAPDGQITLQEDVHFEMKLTEGLSAVLLGNLHPTLDDAIGSEQPARLMVRKEGFDAQLGTFDLASVSMSGTLSPGIVHMRRSGWVNQGVLGLIMRGLGSLGLNEPDTRDQAPTYLATFSSTDFSLHRGRVETGELWLTTPKMSVGFQGQIDLNDKEIDSMVLGVMGATLIAANPKMANYFDPGSIANLPITGTLDEKQIVYERFLVDLGVAFARKKDKRIAAGLELLGQILGNRSNDSSRENPLWADVNWHPDTNARAFAQSVQDQLAGRADEPVDGAVK